MVMTRMKENTGSSMAAGFESARKVRRIVINIDLLFCSSNCSVKREMFQTQNISIKAADPNQVQFLP